MSVRPGCWGMVAQGTEGTGEGQEPSGGSLSEKDGPVGRPTPLRCQARNQGVPRVELSPYPEILKAVRTIRYDQKKAARSPG